MSPRIHVVQMAWVLMGVLAIAAFLLATSPNSATVSADPKSYDPLGTAAFAEMIRRSGYNVRVDDLARPNVKPGELAIQFRLEAEASAQPKAAATRRSRARRQTGADKSGSTWDAISPAVRAGANAMLLSFPRKDAGVLRSRVMDFPGSASKPGSIAARPDSACPEVLTQSAPIGQLSDGRPVGWLRKLENGWIIAPVDGSIALNSNIGKEENARILMRLITMVARPSTPIVLVTADLGEGRQPGVMESIGKWAQAAWSQLMLFLLLGALTLGARFGLPEEMRTKQQGAREFMEALASVLERGQRADRALLVCIRRTEADIRRYLKIAKTAPIEDYQEALPEPLVSALSNAHRALTEETEAGLQLEAAIKLDEKRSELLKTRR